MKKIFLILFITAGVLSLTSCITSLQPLVTYDKIITDQRIAGTWNYEGTEISVVPIPKSTLFNEVQQTTTRADKVFAFTGDPVKDSILFNKAYMVSYKENGVSYHLVAALMKSGRHTFMDIYPAVMNDTKVKEDESASFDFNSDYLPGFTLAKVDFTQQGLSLSFIDGAFVKQQVLAGKIKLKHESNELFDTFLITADSDELQKFLEKYADDERIFSKKSIITLTRQPIHS